MPWVMLLVIWLALGVYTHVVVSEARTLNSELREVCTTDESSA